MFVINPSQDLPELAEGVKIDADFYNGGDKINNVKIGFEENEFLV